MSNSHPGEVILSAQGVSKSFGGQPILREVSLSLHEGERIGLVGRNGCGKSTLLRILARLERPDEGEVTQRRGLRLTLLSQDFNATDTDTVGAYLDEATGEVRGLLEDHDTLALELSRAEVSPRARTGLQSRYDALHHEIELRDGWNLQSHIDRVSGELGLPPAEQSLSTLSGGERRRVDIAASLLQTPDVLLLDEPTNHIDAKSVEWIETFLAGYAGSCIVVTHDRYFLDRVVTRIVEIEFNRVYSFPGNYEEFLTYKSQIEEIRERTERARQGALRRELAWLRQGAKARSTKQKARIQRYDALVEQGPPESHREFSFEIPQPNRLGKRILEAENFSLSFGDRTLFRNFSIIMQAHMRVGLLGPNGCGKTSLVRALMGLEERATGTLKIGDTTEFLYIDQTHSEIDPEKTVLDFVSNGANYWEVNGRRLYVPSYLEKFLFDMETVRVPVRNLSGGERNRIELARKMLQGGNFLVLDEPTNDLDLPTLRVLEEAVEAFEGCAFLISHDRYFLNRLCTHIIVFEPDGSLYFSAGNYDDYLLYRERSKESASDGAAARGKRDRQAAPSGEPDLGPKRLTYREQEELAGIEAGIEEAEAAIAQLEQTIGQPDFYQGPHEAVQETLRALEKAKLRTQELYRRWEDLESRAHIK